MKNIIIIYVYLLSFVPIIAQNNDATWIFYSDEETPVSSIFYGNSVLRFTDDSLSINWENRNVVANATWGLVSNEDGHLQFYSNGCSIFSNDDNLMENGDSLNYPQPLWSFYCDGGYDLADNILIIPVPNNTNQFYMFYSKSSYLGATDFLYAKIDMSQNGGKGKVILKNQTLINGSVDRAACVKHANGRDWWVVLPGNINNIYYKFLVRPDSIEGPYNQYVTDYFIDSLVDVGTKIFSPNGLIYIDCYGHKGIFIYDFDRCTGLLSNFQYIPNSVGEAFHNLAISPDSRYLYLSLTNTGKLIQYDLTSDVIASTGDTVGIFDGYYDTLANHATNFGWMQLAPDGKIYMATQAQYLHVIQDPNQPGALCHFEQRAIELPSAPFPPITPHFPNYRLGPIDGSPCDTLGINNIPVAKFRCKADPDDPLSIIFTDLSYYEPAEWSWNFDDGSGGSTEENPIHGYQDYGIYDVCLTVSNPYGTDTWCKQISIIPTATGDIPIRNGFLFYPNPASEELHLAYTLSGSDDYQLVLYNALGQMIRKIPLSKQSADIVIPMNALPSGLYYGVVDDGKSVVFRGKVVKK